MAITTAQNVEQTKLLSDPSTLFAGRTTAEEAQAGLTFPEDIRGAIENSKQLAQGVLPDDVKAQIEQVSAEKALSGGIGSGQASKNLTLRDFGLTSIEALQQGIQGLAHLGAVQYQYDQLKENMRQWDDQVTEMAAKVDLSASQLQLTAANNIIQTQEFTQELISNLLIADSQNAITSVNNQISELETFFSDSQKAILQLAGIGG